MNPLGIERLGTFGMPPLEMAQLAADLGADCIGISLVPTSKYNPDGHREWSLRDDPRERRETVAVCRDLGVRISIVEGFAVLTDNRMSDFVSDLDIVRELGCERINVVSVNQDVARTVDGFAELCELAAERGIEVSAEMGSLGPFKRVSQAVDMVRAVDKRNFSLVIDTMHYFRLGNSVAELTSLEPAHIGYVQLADAPWQPRFNTYMEEALYERMVPGEGELPLADLLRHVPDGVVISIEVPLRSRAAQGIGVRERTAVCVEAARALLSQCK